MRNAENSEAQGPTRQREWQYKLFNILILIALIAMTNALVKIVFNWMQSMSG